MTVKKKMAILFLVDLVIIWFSICSAYYFRFEGPAPEQYANQMFLYCIISSVLCGISMAYFGMYRKMWQYASVSEMFSMCVAVTIGWAFSFAATTIVSDIRVPLSIAVRTLETSLLLVGGVRVVWRVIRLRQGEGRGLSYSHFNLWRWRLRRVGRPRVQRIGYGRSQANRIRR
ncbi:hypothetical protein [Cohnella rhizosphaerae]|uniref:hypothetical protein n=1 Tax=Cohnella rhizosphaerae TaxID=1457232 RepID=UPI0030B88E5B